MLVVRCAWQAVDVGDEMRLAADVAGEWTLLVGYCVEFDVCLEYWTQSTWLQVNHSG